MPSPTSIYSSMECPGGGCRQPRRTAWIALAAGFAVGLFSASAVGAFASAGLPRVCRPPIWAEGR